MDSIAGCVIPIVILTFFEIYSRVKGKEDPGYEVIQQHKDPTAYEEPGEMAKKATKFYSHMAITVFCITIGVIALLLTGMLIVKDPKTMAVSGIVIWFIVAILILIAIYVIYRIIDYKKNGKLE